MKRSSVPAPIKALMALGAIPVFFVLFIGPVLVFGHHVPLARVKAIGWTLMLPFNLYGLSIMVGLFTDLWQGRSKP